MESQLQPNGSVNYDSGTEANPVFNTAYVIPALAGRPLPIAAVARAAPASSATVPDGVSAGGGGSGAPLFSRPQPQSEGRARGGVRVLGSSARHPAKRTAGVPETAAGGPGPAAGGPAPAAGATVPAAPQEPAPGRAARGRTPDVAVEPQVSGLLLASSRSAREENGAPGLRSAGEGGSATLAGALGVLIAVLAVAGSQLERRRPQEVL